MKSDHEQRLRDLTKIFLEENKKLNLSAFRTEDACWHGNVLDSLPFLDLEIAKGRDLKILDIGTGGGFPLLALAICMPESSFTGLDSVQKKIDAIQRIVDALEIPNVKLICGRAEEIGRDSAHRAQYDIVTSRAVAPLNVLMEYSAPLLTLKGHAICWKSISIDQEMQESLAARSELSCHLVKTHTYDLPGDWGTRQLLVFEKTTKTSDEYPREVGVPKKTPIL